MRIPDKPHMWPHPNEAAAAAVTQSPIVPNTERSQTAPMIQIQIQIQIPLLSFVQQYIKGYYYTIKDDDTHIQTHITTN